MTEVERKGVHMADHGAELPRINWHHVGVLGSVVSQAVMGFAAWGSAPSLGHTYWVWYASTFAGIALTYFVVRRHQSPWWWLSWPTLCLTRVLIFEGIDRPAAQLVLGLITLMFLYAGLTQPPRRSLVLLPLATITLLTLSDLQLQATLIRLSIATMVWSISSELPAYLLRRLTNQQDLLAVAATTDVLTGARNRFGLDETLRDMCGRAFLVILDLDEFKHYNDRFGHTAGDHVLAEFAAMLHRETRRDDVVVRYGGEEFLIVLADVEQSIAESIVDRWAQSWREHSSGTSFSAGITDLSDDNSVSMADAAMYAAKAGGRDRTVLRLSTTAASLTRF